MDAHLQSWEQRAAFWIWVAVVITLLMIPMEIIRYGYLPGDDALRHAGKAISGKPWAEIMVMRPDITFDHNPGWHKILEVLHRSAGWNADRLVCFSVVSLFWIFMLGALPWMRRPEAWLLALLVSTMASGSSLFRLLLGRPFILSMAATLALLGLWTVPGAARRPGWRIAASAVLIGVSVWVHGSWFLFALPVAAFVAARRWREAAGLAAATVLGVVLGALPTGEPLRYLAWQLDHLSAALGQDTLQRMLVGEFQPTSGVFFAVLVVALVLVAKARTEGLQVLHGVLRDPVFLLILMGWLLGLKVGRFWHDWGFPSFLLWLAREFSAGLRPLEQGKPGFRFCLAGFACAALYLSCTTDLGGRWTRTLTQAYLYEGDPPLAGWLPEPGGIIYSDDMSVFYQTFFKNPHAPWRYILGYEPGLMPEDDLKIYRNIQWKYG
ncbi:MAG TPA: hypothetical protein DCM68_00520, partial [Verrucomicrobia bacterium]|nr:hypothetical protein [Verrucomicrobiota bacterium]